MLCPLDTAKVTANLQDAASISTLKNQSKLRRGHPRSMNDRILLGYEVGSADPVYLLLHHLAIFGMTQLSGKTTTLEALISRSGLKALAFIVKRGESGFTKYNLVTPYYKPRADWQFIEGLVNVALGEKVKFEPGMRYGIMQVCKGRKNIKEIQNAAREYAKTSKRDFMKSVYEKLAAYLEIVIPELEKWTFTDGLELSEGVNVMDLSGMRLETQHLVIASSIEYAFANLDHVIIIIPEAWETIPQGKMTPVKWVAQQFIRKGAALGNYLWLDSQDIGGIDKTPLRQCDNWILGRMKEAHEVERILKQLLGMKVSAEEIQTLPLGHFYAAIGNDVKKVYVLPAGVSEDVGREVALGKRSPESIREEFLKFKVMESDDLVWKEKYDQLKKEFDEWKAVFENEVIKCVAEQTKDLKARVHELEIFNERLARENNAFVKLKEGFLELLPMSIPSRSIPEGNGNQKISLDASLTEVTVEDKAPKEISMSTETPSGKVMYSALQLHERGQKTFSSAELQKEALEYGWQIPNRSIGGTLMVMVREGQLIQEGRGYRLPSKLKINVKESQ